MAITTEMRTQVLELYTAYFNRAADKAGVDYWTNEMDTKGWTLDQVAQSFADQTEYTTAYAGKTNEEIVDAVYSNVLNRAADTDGKTYWVDELTAGTMSVKNLIQAVVTAAKEDKGGLGDDDVLANKVAVSEYAYAENLNEAAAKAVSLTAITADATTVETVKTEVVTAKADYTPVTAALTTGADTLTGSKADDTFNGALTTIANGDTIDGGAGTDTLNMEISSSLNSTFKATNIENVNVTTYGANSIDMTNMAAVENLADNNSSGKLTVTNIQDATMAVSLKGDVSNSISLAYKTGATNGSSDTLAVTLNGATAASVTTTDTGFETVTVDTTAESTLNTLTAANATTLNLSGTGALTLGTSLAMNTVKITDTAAVTLNNANPFTAVKTLDATSNTGGIVASATQVDTIATNLTYNMSTAAITMHRDGGSVLLGSGNDNINVSATNVSSTGTTLVKTGAGNDMIDFSANGSGKTYLYAEAGDDSIYLGAALGSNDVVDGGAGTDTLSFTNGTFNFIAKGVENAKVNAATTVNFVTTDTKTAIEDSGAANAVTFGNILNGSTYTASKAKTANIALNFKSNEAATINVDLTKGTTNSVALSNVKDATVTLGAASGMGTSTIQLDKAAESLTINATGNFTTTTTGGIVSDTTTDTTTSEKLATLNVTGDKNVAITTLLDDKSLVSIDVKSTATTAGTGDVALAARSGIDSDVLMTSVKVTSAAGKATLGALDAVNATNTAGIDSLTVTGASATASSVASITADHLTTVNVTNTLGASTIGAITVNGSGTDYTDGKIGNITVSSDATTNDSFVGQNAAGAGAGAGVIVADSIGTITATSAKGKATIGNIALTNNNSSYLDASISALKASALGDAEIGSITADKVDSIVVESTGTVTAAAATLGAISDASSTGNKATIGTIDVSSAGTATVGAISAASLGNTTVTSSAANVALGAISVADGNVTSTTGTLTVSAKTNIVDGSVIGFEKAGDIKMTATTGKIDLAGITVKDASGETITLNAATTTDTSAVIENTLGDLNVVLKGNANVGLTAFSVKADSAAHTDVDLVLDASSSAGLFGDATHTVTVTNAGTDANSSTLVKMGSATTGSNYLTVATGTSGTVEVNGSDTIDNIVVTGTATATLYGNKGNDNFIFSGTDLTADDAINGGVGTADAVVLNNAAAVSGIVSLANVTNVESFTVTGSTNHDASLTISTGSNLTTDTTYAVNAAAISDGAGSELTFDASADTNAHDIFNITASAGGDTITGGAGADIIADGALLDTITGGKGNDHITLSGDTKTDTIVFESTASSNGQDAITGVLAAKVASNGDILNFDAFVDIDGVTDVTANETGTAVLDAEVGSNATFNIASDVVFMAKDVNYGGGTGGNAVDEISAAIEETGGNNNMGLAEGAKAVVLYGDFATGAQTYDVYYVTSTTGDTETVELVGTVSVNDGDAMVANQFIV